MSTMTINSWVQQEAGSLNSFEAPIASRLEESIMRALTETMRIQLKETGSASVELPWGTYSAEVLERGDTANITPTWKPSKAFMKLLNGDDGSRDFSMQLEYDPKFIELFTNCAAYGKTNPDKNPDKIPISQRGVMLHDEEINYVLNGYANVLATLAKEKQHNGKVFTLTINNSYPHGAFHFEYDDNEISVKFVPDKVFKQMLKDDELANTAQYADFTPIPEGTTRKEIIPTHDIEIPEDADLKEVQEQNKAAEEAAE